MYLSIHGSSACFFRCNGKKEKKKDGECWQLLEKRERRRVARDNSTPQSERCLCQKAVGIDELP